MRQRSPLYRLLLLLDNHLALFFALLMQPRQVIALSCELLVHVFCLLPPAPTLVYVPLLLTSVPIPRESWLLLQALIVFKEPLILSF